MISTLFFEQEDTFVNISLTAQTATKLDRFYFKTFLECIKETTYSFVNSIIHILEWNKPSVSEIIQHLCSCITNKSLVVLFLKTNLECSTNDLTFWYVRLTKEMVKAALGAECCVYPPSFRRKSF